MKARIRVPSYGAEAAAPLRYWAPALVLAAGVSWALVIAATHMLIRLV